MTLLLLVVVYGATWLSDRRRAADGWFALQVTCGLAVPLVALGASQPLFGAREFGVLCFAATCACVAGVHLVHRQFGMARPSRLWAVAIALTLAATVIGGGPFAAARWVLPLELLVAGATLPYLCCIFVRQIRRRLRPGQAAVHLVGWLALAVVATPDAMAWAGVDAWFAPYRTTSLALIFYVAMQSIVLALERVHALAQADSLNVELRAANEELRHQIAEGSRQLADVLTRLSSGGAPLTALAAGHLIDARYRVVRPIGAGAMGRVYEVERITDGRRLALKLLHGSRPGAGALAGFAREAQIAAQLDHPNLIAVVDVAVTTSGFLYLVMELVEGGSRTLSDRPAAHCAQDLVEVGLALAAAKRVLDPAGVLNPGALQ